ncbi:unnamed protein product [Calypogeia fissa]
MGVPTSCKFSAVLLIAFLLPCNISVSSSRLLPKAEGISTSRVLLGVHSNNDGLDCRPPPPDPFPISDPHQVGDPPMGPIPDLENWIGHPPTGPTQDPHHMGYPPGPDASTPDSPGPNGVGPDAPAPDAPGPDVLAPNVPGPDAPGSDAPAPDAAGPDAPAPDAPGPDA